MSLGDEEGNPTVLALKQIGRRIVLVLAAGVAFFGFFLVTQWFFSAFLISPAAQNWFFAADRHWGYREGAGDWRGQFWSQTNPNYNPPLGWKGGLKALAYSVAACRVGLWFGNWMAKVRR